MKSGWQASTLRWRCRALVLWVQVAELSGTNSSLEEALAGAQAELAVLSGTQAQLQEAERELEELRTAQQVGVPWRLQGARGGGVVVVGGRGVTCALHPAAGRLGGTWAPNAFCALH